MKEEILAYLSNGNGATMGAVLAAFTLHSRDRETTRRFVLQTVDELMREGAVKRQLHKHIGWVYSLAERSA